MTAPSWLDLRLSPANLVAIVLAIAAFGGYGANVKAQLDANRADLIVMRSDINSMRDQFERRETAEMRNTEVLRRLERMERKIDQIK